MPNDPFVVEWFRPDARSPLIKLWVTTGLMVILGIIFVGLFVTALFPLPAGARTLFAVLGLGLAAAGPLLAAVRSIRILSDETYLLLRSDGVVLQEPEQSTRVEWTELADVSFEEGGMAVLLHLDEGEPVAIRGRFLGIDGPGLARRVKEVRRDALMGLLRPSRS